MRRNYRRTYRPGSAASKEVDATGSASTVSAAAAATAMKTQESHFEEYLSEGRRASLHPHLHKAYQHFPARLEELRHVILFGPAGTGKYTQALECIRRYSPSDLKYEKKMTLTFNKQTMLFKVSDVHYEVDMALLGCNSRALWHELHAQIMDSISAKKHKCGIILCKNFHDIHSELLDSFYSYMQHNYFTPVRSIFLLVTEQLSFLPHAMQQACEIIHVPRPSAKAYQHACGVSAEQWSRLGSVVEERNAGGGSGGAWTTSNIKLLRSMTACLSTSTSTSTSTLIPAAADASETAPAPQMVVEEVVRKLTAPHEVICTVMLDILLHPDKLHFLQLRETIYDWFTYNLDVGQCVWFLLSRLMEEGHLAPAHHGDALRQTYRFLQYYNNNYRPVFHVENYLLYLVALMHDDPHPSHNFANRSGSQDGMDENTFHEEKEKEKEKEKEGKEETEEEVIQLELDRMDLCDSGKMKKKRRNV